MAAVSHILRHLRLPLLRIMLGIRPYCGEGLLCIFVADEGEKRGEGRIRIYSGDEEVMERSGKDQISMISSAIP